MIYVISDIHGNQRRFDSILRQICLQPEDTLYVLGDVIDRHPDGVRLLRHILSMPNARMLLGNHEYMMLRALGCPYDDHVDTGTALEHWYRNGGKVTHDHWKHIRKSTRRQIVEYLLELPLQFDLEVAGVRYRLVHGAPVDAFDHDPKYKNPTHFAVWKRWTREDVLPEGPTMIFGHTPTQHYTGQLPMEIWYGDHCIAVDCGSGYPEESGGRLSCLCLDDGRVFYSEEV